MIPEQARYIFKRTGCKVFNRYYPEVFSGTDTEDIDEILLMLRGFLLSAGWQPETINDAIVGLANEIKELDEQD